jgi:hypothetical protein
MIAAASFQDHQAHPIAVREDGRVPEAQHPETLPLKIARPALIIGDLIRMLSAIHLHHEARFGAVEVDDVGAARDLALPPPPAEAAITKGDPEARLWVCILATQAAGAVSLRRVSEGANLGHGIIWIMAGPLCKGWFGAAPHPTLSPRASRRGRGED